MNDNLAHMYEVLNNNKEVSPVKLNLGELMKISPKEVKF